ncbi:MAG: hypothetical protein DRJ03_17070 [Chloroflexi bacterium]|nr:MAG: hypothetical protein DRJ03_17070 [Chloroflexota bacterium]
MGAPTTEFKQVPVTTDGSTIEDADLRYTAVNGFSAVDVGTPLDFGSVSISGGAADSSVQAVVFRVSAFNGATDVTNLRFWVTYDFIASTVEWASPKLTATTEWVQNPTTSSYTYATLPVSEPGSANLNKADGVTANLTAEVPTGSPAYSDTTEAMVMYVAVGATENLGTYTGSGGSQDFQYNLKFDFS